MSEFYIEVLKNQIGDKTFPWNRTLTSRGTKIWDKKLGFFFKERTIVSLHTKFSEVIHSVFGGTKTCNSIGA